VCPLQPPDLGAVGAYYDDFAATTDAEVLELLGR
jgi:predicted phosphoribosyltransferase